MVQLWILEPDYGPVRAYEHGSGEQIPFGVHAQDPSKTTTGRVSDANR